MKGIIALDIDGTITPEHHGISREIVTFLGNLHEDGWRLIFITGRTFSWGYSALRFLPFPYYFAVQNGAIILEMPSRKILSKKYLDHSIIPAMETICQGKPTDFVVYAGYEFNDRCFYRPKHFDKDLLDYLKTRQQGLEESWEAVESFDELPIDSFPSVKCFGKMEWLKGITEEIESKLQLHIPVIRDTFNENYYVAQATNPLVSKGYALKDFIKFIGERGVVIAAGDDYNDRTMLDEADIKVVMATAPQDLRDMADIIAPSANVNGIIQGLMQAVQGR